MATGYIDFAQLKASVSIEQVLDMLSIKLVRRQHQLRGTCPICKKGGDRGFVVTPAKNLWMCFSGCGGGDTIKLVSLVKGLDAKAAATLIAEQYGTVRNSNSTVSKERATVPPARTAFDAEKYAKTLDPAHEALAALGVAEETYREWKAGYSSSGVLRGKLALPIASKDGTVVAYLGRMLKDETPLLSFPSGVVPTDHIFGADRVTEGELTLVRDPLEVLKAWENGVTNCVSFLTETIAPMQLEQLAALMDERQCQELQLF